MAWPVNKYDNNDSSLTDGAVMKWKVNWKQMKMDCLKWKITSFKSQKSQNTSFRCWWKWRVMQLDTKGDTEGLWQLVDVLLEDLHNMCCNWERMWTRMHHAIMRLTIWNGIPAEILVILENRVMFL